MKRKLLIGSIISGFFLYLALRGTQWDVLWEVLGRTRVPFFVLALAVTLIGHYFRAYRWRFMLVPIKPIAMNSVFSATMIGSMANNLLPARLGELVRAYVLGRREQISRTASFATIVYERIVDVFTLLVLTWLMLTSMQAPEWLKRSALWLLFANVLLMMAMFAMERYRGSVTRLVARAASKFSRETQAKIQRVTEGYLGGLATMTHARAFLPIVLTSGLVWGFGMLGAYFSFSALRMPLPVAASLAVTVLVAMGSMIPSAPAFLGTTQYACVVALGLFGIEKSEALAYSILYHSVIFFPPTIVGLYCLWKAHIRFRDISKG